ncbi:MAG: cytochrome c [Gracilimonas sp.]|uniref:c-type cytochrome n=1 Tax=Gracilimonas sp. TaxID=1974203 RepID=UPI0037532A15|nr:cytochrome c [Gracilimonas sp.]
MKNPALKFILLVFLTVLSVSCQMGRSDYMTGEQRRQIETAYDSLQTAYKTMLAKYQASLNSAPANLHSLYTQMQQMHGRMEASYQQMMSGNMQDKSNRMMGSKNGMMGNRLHMMRQMRSNQTGEWYQQMMSMHDRVAAMHNQQGEHQMAEMNRRLSEEYGDVMDLVPGLDEPKETLFNEDGDYTMLNGENLFTQNCASCYGTDGNGLANTFPPLVNSEWITEEKSIPNRILMNGLTGSIGVNSQSYSGTMPSFRARLSAAEMAAILNYPRTISDEELPEITQEEIIRIGQMFRDRTRPWTAGELRGKRGN